MKTATLPVVRVAPATRELIESVLREGETLSTFIEASVCERAQWRKEDDAFYAEALRRSELVRAGKMKTISAEDSIKSLRAVLAKKKAEQQTQPT